MKCIIDQPAGLGDIFFCQKIGYHYQNQGYEIIWPVKSVYSYLSKYLTNFSYPVVDHIKKAGRWALVE